MGKLNIDRNIELWLPVFKAISKGDSSNCPRCGSKNLTAQANDLGGKIGYVVITCNNCNKSGYFSRVDLKNYKGTIEMNDSPKKEDRSSILE